MDSGKNIRRLFEKYPLLPVKHLKCLLSYTVDKNGGQWENLGSLAKVNLPMKTGRSLAW